nr:hypothetical protein [Gemmatimonadaceae bacterium]
MLRRPSGMIARHGTTRRLVAAQAAAVGLTLLAGAELQAQVPADSAQRDSAAVLAPVRVEASRIAGARSTAPYASSVR